jgi:hypothetical protein
MNIKSLTGLLIFKDNLYSSSRVAELCSVTLDVTSIMHEVIRKTDA